MKKIFKIFIGAVMIAGFSYLVYYVLWNLIFLMKQNNLPNWVFLLQMVLLLVAILSGVTINIIIDSMSDKWNHFNSIQSKWMLLISNMIYVVMLYLGMGVWEPKLSFEEGLALVIGLLITLAIVGVWALILIGQLIGAYRKAHKVIAQEEHAEES